MTKTIKRLLPAALAVLLAGCAMQPVDSTTARYRVALIAKNNRDSEFWNAVFIGAEAAATEYNLQLTITAPDDEEDYAAQNQLIADAVEDGAQAIVFSAIDYEANAAAIDAAAAAGVTVISVDSAVNSDNVAAYIGADNYGAGRMAAQSALDGTAGTLCVGLINYEVNGANGQDREQGARDAFAESGRARITAAVSTHPNAASARADTLAMLRTHPEINVLIALNETTAVGAAQAVQQMQRADDLWLAAFDSNIETIDALQTGTVDTLIVQNTYGMGYFGVESAYKLLAGQASGFGGMVSFEVKSPDLVPEILKKVKVFLFAESLGGAESLITFPVVQTHGDVPVEARERLGIGDRLLRLSLGLEDADDLIADLDSVLGGSPCKAG